MRVSVNLSVKGTRYYEAARLLQGNVLSPGLLIRLEHEANNPHDRNAVAVRAKMTGAKLGHVSKELAPKYSELVRSGKIIEAAIASVSKDGTDINILVRVVYDQLDDQVAEKHSSRFWQSATSMPAETGVYAVRNIESGRQYIGSSTNIKDRIHSHIRDLSLGRHANHVLQADFSRLGLNYFEARVLARGVSPSNLAAVEADQISSFLNAAAALYNLTLDGQGTGRNFHAVSNSEPVSDKRAKQRAEVEQQRVDAAVALAEAERSKAWTADCKRFKELETKIWQPLHEDNAKRPIRHIYIPFKGIVFFGKHHKEEACISCGMPTPRGLMYLSNGGLKCHLCTRIDIEAATMAAMPEADRPRYREYVRALINTFRKDRSGEFGWDKALKLYCSRVI